MSKRSRRFDGRKLEWFKSVRRFVLLCLALFILFRSVISIAFVDGVSMENTYFKNDLVIYTRIVKSAQTGDVVYVRRPNGEAWIKRVVAVEGDIIDIRDGMVYINGIAEDGIYVNGETKPEDLLISYPYTVPEGYVFVLGDNRLASVDSRSFGAINVSKDIKGRILLRLGTGKLFKGENADDNSLS